MIKSVALLILFSLTIFARAQTPAIPSAQPYGMIDTSDLDMKECDFEKDANAMILFDKATVTYNFSNIVMERHKRIKIFNDNAMQSANIRIEYSVYYQEEITDIEAETINLSNKVIEYLPVDRKLIYTENIDKQNKAIVFTFPSVKAGSVIEFKYKFTTPYSYQYPAWNFQNSIPTRYSELDASFNSLYKFNILKNTLQPFIKDFSIPVDLKMYQAGDRHLWAMANIKTFKMEPYSDYPLDYFQCITFRSFNSVQSWALISDIILRDADFGSQLNKHLDRESEIIDKANALKTTDQKIAYIFNTVKHLIKWNKIDTWYTIDGVKKAWDQKTGNATEINLILYHLLKSANLKPFLMVLRTRERGRLLIDYPSVNQLNKTVVYFQRDTSNYYVLDASDLYNSFDQMPFNLMGLNTLFLDPANKTFKVFSLKKGNATEALLINGDIDIEGKLEGNFQIESTNYSRAKYLRKYNTLGEKTYIDQLQSDYNGLRITSLKLENPDNDSLALIQNFEFKFNLTEPDGDYIYFNPNQFTGFQNNPFLSETRVSNIDFGGRYNYSIIGYYKMPSGYKINVLPKSANLQMPDKSIVFKRVIGEQGSSLVVRYTIDYNRSLFSKDEYLLIHEFFKKMYEMLNEQIVLKKT